MDILLRLGADLRAMDERGRSAMVLTATDERLEVLQTALSAGGDPNERTPLGEPLSFVTIDFFYWDHLDAILDAGADINATNRDGQTAILRLAMLNQYEQVAKLIQRGAKLDIADKSGLTLAKQIPQSRMEPDSPLEAWRERVKQMLRARGIDVPDDG
jgi:ankyrin repeat protein